MAIFFDTRPKGVGGGREGGRKRGREGEQTTDYLTLTLECHKSILPHGSQ